MISPLTQLNFLALCLDASKHLLLNVTLCAKDCKCESICSSFSGHRVQAVDAKQKVCPYSYLPCSLPYL